MNTGLSKFHAAVLLRARRMPQGIWWGYAARWRDNLPQKVAWRNQPVPQNLVLICHAFSGKLQDSEIPKYWILALKRGQKTVRHSEISNYHKIALRKILSNAAPVVAIRHRKSLRKEIPLL
ncbi:MAG: hypothetical protein LBG83_07720 [Oscillospiraceae bacterium]|nr:hypothetical protein [Oscillospiraceae bacterium]